MEKQIKCHWAESVAVQLTICLHSVGTARLAQRTWPTVLLGSARARGRLAAQCARRPGRSHGHDVAAARHHGEAAWFWPMELEEEATRHSPATRAVVVEPGGYSGSTSSSDHGGRDGGARL
jgi:hypothetical protein